MRNMIKMESYNLNSPRASNYSQGSQNYSCSNCRKNTSYESNNNSYELNNCQIQN